MKETEQIAREQLRTAELVEMDERLALVAISSFVAAFELLRPVA